MKSKTYSFTIIIIFRFILTSSRPQLAPSFSLKTGNLSSLSSHDYFFPFRFGDLLLLSQRRHLIPLLQMLFLGIKFGYESSEFSKSNLTIPNQNSRFCMSFQGGWWVGDFVVDVDLIISQVGFKGQFLGPWVGQLFPIQW